VRRLLLLIVTGAGVIASACSGDTNAPTPPSTFAPQASIGFANAGGNGSTLVLQRESGYLILPYSGNWTVSTQFGHPAPFIQIMRPASQDTTSAEIRITADGAAFRFTSVDLYSSITPIPYSFTGFRGTSPVFTIADTVPNTFGNFATVVNRNSRDVIDGLVIRLVNPQCGLIACSNPVGLDNIVVGY
jgi:hypothetical protein